MKVVSLLIPIYCTLTTSVVFLTFLGLATSSSIRITDHNYPNHPAFAIDGLISTWPLIFSSDAEDYPWIQIQLSSKRNISGVVISNLLYEKGEPLKSSEVRVGRNGLPTDFMRSTKIDTNTVCGTFDSIGKTIDVQPIWCVTPILANFITIQLLAQHIRLQVNEVDVIEGIVKMSQTIV